MGESTAKGANARQRILESAYRLFLLQGYHGTSMRQVARSAGLSPAAIYNHFESKEVLFTALLAERIPHRALVKAVASVQESNPDRMVHQAFAAMQQAMADQFDNLRLMFIELIEFQGRHASDLAGDLLPELLAFTGRLREQDPRIGRFRNELLTRAFFGLYFSYTMTAVLLAPIPGFEPNSADLQRLADLFLNGVRGGGPPAAG
jgi:AcrR family transcriptional regulator